MPTLLDCGATIAGPGDQPGALITAARQIEFGGLLFGAGTPYRWKNLNGWDDLPAIDLSDAARETADGDDIGPGYRQARMPALDMSIHADTPAQMEQLTQLLVARVDYTDAEQPLHVRDTGRHLVVMARVVQRIVPHVPMRTIGVLEGIGIQWKATDPRRYSPGRHTTRLTPAQGTGGETYPSSYPSDYGTPGGVGSRTVVNATADGGLPSSPVVTFTGPADGGYAVGIGDRWLRYDLPLAAGDSLRVDTRTGTVLLNGSTDRSSWINPASEDPQSWRLPPGESTVTLSVPAGAGAGTAADLEWSDTWK